MYKKRKQKYYQNKKEKYWKHSLNENDTELIYMDFIQINFKNYKQPQPKKSRIKRQFAENKTKDSAPEHHITRGKAS